MESAALSGAPAVWLAQTKFHSPRLRDDVIPRPRLLTALRDAVTSHPLTLLSAPAGYGKTTLIADFGMRISELDDPQSEIRNPKFCWLSLDEEDNDPLRFLAAVVAALQRL